MGHMIASANDPSAFVSQEFQRCCQHWLMSQILTPALNLGHC